MDAKESPAMTDFDAGTNTEKARHTQWRKLSRKRRKTLILRSLQRLEKQAKRKSVFVGMEDYSHVQSLVFSELPYNPNGHHCSCNCLDEVTDSPELELYGWNYGKRLKSVELGEISDVGRESSSNKLSTTEDENNEKEDRDSAAMGACEDNNQSPESPRKQHSGISLSRSEDGRQARHSCHCDRVVSRGMNGRRSINKQMFQAGISPRAVCSNCQKIWDTQNRLKNISSSRRISFAKEDGTLRSRIYALRQKLRHYSDLIERSQNLAVEARVKRKLTLASKLQKKAMNLSDKMKLMKFRESYFRNKNMELEQRLHKDNQEAGYDGNVRKGLGKDSNEFRSSKAEDKKETGEIDDYVEAEDLGYHSPRKTGRRKVENDLPAVIEEDEENLRDVYSSDGRIQQKHNSQADKRLKKEPKSYDILFINHSDNEIDDKSNDDDYGEDSDNSEEDLDGFAKSWPMQKHESMNLGLRRHRRTQRGDREKSKVDLSPEISVRRLVHRLDSGLSFGPADAEILRDESLAASINKIEKEKVSNSKLSEDDYDKPLVERQQSYGETIRAVIREEISKKGNGSQDESRIVEDQEKQIAQKEEMKRREKLLEENFADFVDEAQKKRETVEDLLKDRDSGIAETRALTSEDESNKDEYDMNEDEVDDDSGLSSYNMKRPKLVDLSTLRTLAQRHQTLKSLRNLDEEMYQVDKGIDKLNKYRMMEAKANGFKYKDLEDDELLVLSKTEQQYSIPSPINKKSMVEERIATNNKTISKIDYNYDLIRDLRYLILNQNTSRAASYSYFKPAPPYLKTKWQRRIKRGFLRGVKEQHVNEVQLEKVEDVTLRHIDRNEIHRVTLQDKGKGEKEKSIFMDSSPPSRLSTGRKNNTFTELIKDNTGIQLPPLKLPGSRGSSPVDSLFDESGSRSRTLSMVDDNMTLEQAFKRLDMRHKFLEKKIMMKDVIKLTARIKNGTGHDGPNFKTDSSILDTDRPIGEGHTEEQFTSRLKSNRRQSVAAVQNVAIRDQLTGRVSVNSNERKRFSLQAQSIQEY